MSDWDEDDFDYGDDIDFDYYLFDEDDYELTDDESDDTIRDLMQIEIEMLEYELIVALDEGDIHRAELIRDDIDLLLLDMKGD